jgi:hypothetical protein
MPAVEMTAARRGGVYSEHLSPGGRGLTFDGAVTSADLPLLVPTKALVIEVPPTLLARADQVVE